MKHWNSVVWHSDVRSLEGKWHNQTTVINPNLLVHGVNKGLLILRQIDSFVIIEFLENVSMWKVDARSQYFHA